MSLRAPEFLAKPVVEHQLSSIYRFAMALNGQSIRTVSNSTSTKFDSRISDVIVILIEARGQAIDSSALASAGGLSRSQLYESFKEATGLSPLQYANALRVEHSVELLCHQDAPILEIALELGFSSQANFSRFIKRHISMSPGRFRRACSVRRTLLATQLSLTYCDLRR